MPKIRSLGHQAPHRPRGAAAGLLDARLRSLIHEG